MILLVLSGDFVTVSNPKDSFMLGARSRPPAKTIPIRLTLTRRLRPGLSREPANPVARQGSMVLASLVLLKISMRVISDHLFNRERITIEQ